MPAGAPLDLWLWRLARAVLRPFVALYYHIEVRHRTRLPRDGMALITPTHRSRWDHLMVSWAIPRPLFFLASEDDCVGVQGWFMRRLGAIPLNRERPGAGALRLCRTLLLGGHSLVIYPEGGIFRYPKGEVHPLKPGVAWLALECQRREPGVPLRVVPVRLVYSDRVLRFGSRADIVIQEPIEVRRYVAAPRGEGIALLTAAIQQALGETVRRDFSDWSSPR
jgi:1-acyl-sn-glycerol-3-phosphate acyltransferase